jgi:hypothetical protein
MNPRSNNHEIAPMVRNLGYESAFKLPTFAERRAFLKQAESDLVARAKAWESAGQIFMLVCSRGARGDCLGTRTTVTFMPDYNNWVLVAVTRAQARFVLVQTAAALAAWRLDHGGVEYPGSLDDLVPQYMPAVPIDPFSDKPFIYELQDDGYLLASVGQNGVFDGGTDAEGWIVNGEWQDEQQGVLGDHSDLVVRIPVPKRPFVPPTAP